MTNLNIPPEAVEAAARSIATHDGWGINWTAYEETARAAILAALEAWPGMNHDSQAWRGYGGEVLILPLPQDKSDA